MYLFQKNKTCAIFLLSTECPSEFQEISGSCLKKGSGRKTFEEANSACQQLGAFLVEPRTPDINAALRSFSFDTEYLWIGMRDINLNQVFSWQTDNKVLSYADWDNGQPNNWHCNQHCGAIKPNYKWHDISCDMKQEYVCQLSTYIHVFLHIYKVNPILFNQNNHMVLCPRTNIIFSSANGQVFLADLLSGQL